METCQQLQMKKAFLFTFKEKRTSHKNLVALQGECNSLKVRNLPAAAPAAGCAPYIEVWSTPYAATTTNPHYTDADFCYRVQKQPSKQSFIKKKGFWKKRQQNIDINFLFEPFWGHTGWCIRCDRSLAMIAAQMQTIWSTIAILIIKINKIQKFERGSQFEGK